jgi:hypothetical protein
MMAFEIDLKVAPPLLSEKSLDINKYIPVNKRVKSMQLRDVKFDEGILNIYSFLFEDGRCIVQLFGNMRDSELNAQIEFRKDNRRDFDLLNEKIKFLLAKSKNILRTYYKDSKIKNIEYHLIAFLTENRS